MSSFFGVQKSRWDLLHGRKYLELFWTHAVIYDENHPKFSVRGTFTTKSNGLDNLPNPYWLGHDEAEHRNTPMWSTSRTAMAKIRNLAERHPEIARLPITLRDDDDSLTLDSTGAALTPSPYGSLRLFMRIFLICIGIALCCLFANL